MGEPLKLMLKDEAVRPGEPFTCVVLLDPNHELVAQARGVSVRCEWRASRTSRITSEKKTEARWAPELPLRMEYHATLTLPERAPISYAGQVVFIEWFLIAELDVPMKTDPTVTVPLRVVPRARAFP